MIIYDITIRRITTIYIMQRPIIYHYIITFSRFVIRQASINAFCYITIAYIDNITRNFSIFRIASINKTVYRYSICTTDSYSIINSSNITIFIITTSYTVIY